MTPQEACSVYIKLIRRYEKFDKLSEGELALARESFIEGWIQCELEYERKREK